MYKEYFMTGAVEKELFNYIERLNGAQKKSLLGFIKTIFPAKENEEAITIEQYNKDLDTAETEIERGECCTHEDAMEFLKNSINARA